MAIATGLALGLGATALGAGASVLSASKNSKAINQATDAQTQSNAQSVALQKDIYGQNKATLSPFVNRGNVAGDQMNALLGLGGQQQAQPTSQPNALSQFRGGPGAANYYGIGDGSQFNFNSAEQRDFSPQVGANYQQTRNGGAMGVPGAFGVGNIPDMGWNGQPSPQGQISLAQQTGQQGQSPQQAAESAFDVFRNSTGYQFRVGEGMEALNSGYAGSGMLQSGAALKALDDYRQNAATAEFGNYMGYLGQQQGTGLQAAGAQAGVGLNYANNVSSLNQQNANALSNAAVAKANNSNALIGGIAGGIGNILGGL